MKKYSTYLGLALFALLISCDQNTSEYDASGAFDADEIIISAEAQGTLERFDVEEGQTLEKGRQLGHIDSLQLYLKKKQLESQIEALLGRKPNIPVQLSALHEQLNTALSEKNRIEKLVAGDAATSKQLDDIQAEIDVLRNKIRAQQSTLSISTAGIDKDAIPLRIQVEQVEDQLRKSRIVNPIEGTVLTKYAYANELVGMGKPLYKIADLSDITLRAYITGNQLPNVKLNQKVQVLTDDGQGGMNETEGIITWISDKAEFTPKTIQTKEERADKVYAIKVRVDNSEGLYKIGMYGEVKF